MNIQLAIDYRLTMWSTRQISIKRNASHDIHIERSDEMSKSALATVQRIKDVWFAEATYETLGEKLGLPRASIAGYYHRHPELRLTHPVQLRGIVNKNRDATTKRNFSQRAARIEAIATVRQQTREYNGPTGRYTLLTLPHNGCKWPYGEDVSHMTFCGHTRQPGEPYCTEHARLAYTPRSDVRQRKRRAAGMVLERLGR